MTSSTPLISSVPTLSRPTVGRSTCKMMRAIAEPMIARSTRCRASAPTEAPRSSTTDWPRCVGQSAAKAGRSMPGRVRRQIFAIAISAPVLPAETAASASPFLTASIAIHIEETRRPWRSATLGFSSMRIDTAACRTSERSASAGKAASSAEIAVPSPNSRKNVSGRRWSARAAPAMVAAGPKSPPIASSAIRTGGAIVVSNSRMPPRLRVKPSPAAPGLDGRASSRSCGQT